MDAHQAGPVVCIAGVVQGARDGTETADQSYRGRIAAAIRDRFPGATIFCPVTELHGSFAESADALAHEFRSLRAQRVLQEREMPALVLAVRERFSELVLEAGRAGVMIAYLPTELSMGTAMEMWAAHSNGRPVITITGMNQNLAIVSASTVIVPTLEEFEALVTSGELDAYLRT